MDDNTRATIIAAALDRWDQFGQLVIDPDAPIEPTIYGGGYWVQAWVYVLPMEDRLTPTEVS